MVAECDITNPDVVPLPSVTVATMYYSLYMAHTNTDNITIEVNPGNSVTIDMIGKPGGIASLDSKGKIPNEQLPPMDYIPLSQKGVSGGVATLDESGKVPASQIPEVKMDYEPLGSINTHDKDPEAHEPVRRDFNNKVNGLALKISSLESFLYNDLKTNPHSMSFEDLGGVTVTGYWNKSASTLEC